MVIYYKLKILSYYFRCMLFLSSKTDLTIHKWSPEIQYLLDFKNSRSLWIWRLRLTVINVFEFQIGRKVDFSKSALRNFFSWIKSFLFTQSIYQKTLKVILPSKVGSSVMRLFKDFCENVQYFNKLSFFVRRYSFSFAF